MQHNKNRPRQRRFLGNNRIVKLGDSFVYWISFYYFCIDIKNHIGGIEMSMNHSYNKLFARRVSSLKYCRADRLSKALSLLAHYTLHRY